MPYFYSVIWSAFLGKSLYLSTQFPPYRSKGCKREERVGKKRLGFWSKAAWESFASSSDTKCSMTRATWISYLVAVFCVLVMLLAVINVSKTLNFSTAILFRKGMFVHMCPEHAAVWWPFSPRNSWDVCWTFLFSQGFQWCIPNVAGWF